MPMPEGQPISQEDIQFQTSEAMRIATHGVREGFFGSDAVDSYNASEELIAAAKIASTIITLIAEGKIEPFEEPNPYTSVTKSLR